MLNHWREILFWVGYSAFAAAWIFMLVRAWRSRREVKPEDLKYDWLGFPDER
jgi:hypothetical protein